MIWERNKKMKWCLIPMGKIGLMWKLISVCYNICYINLNKRKKKLVRRCFFPLKLSFKTISLVLSDTVRWCGGKDDVLGGCYSYTASIRSARRDPGERPTLTSWSLDPFPDSLTLLYFVPLENHFPFRAQFSPVMWPWMMAKAIPLSLLLCGLSPSSLADLWDLWIYLIIFNFILYK